MPIRTCFITLSIAGRWLLVAGCKTEHQHRSTQQVTELVPGRRVVWSVTEADLPFADDPQEWVGTRMVFDVVPGAEGTEVRFTHVGLRPGLVCYDSCSGAWTQLLAGNLRSRLLAG